MERMWTREGNPSRFGSTVVWSPPLNLLGNCVQLTHLFGHPATECPPHASTGPGSTPNARAPNSSPALSPSGSEWRQLLAVVTLPAWGGGAWRTAAHVGGPQARGRSSFREEKRADVLRERWAHPPSLTSSNLAVCSFAKTRHLEEALVGWREAEDASSSGALRENADRRGVVPMTGRHH